MDLDVSSQRIENHIFEPSTQYSHWICHGRSPLTSAFLPAAAWRARSSALPRPLRAPLDAAETCAPHFQIFRGSTNAWRSPLFRKTSSLHILFCVQAEHHRPGAVHDSMLRSPESATSPRRLGGTRRAAPCTRPGPTICRTFKAGPWTLTFTRSASL
jgi:hypothetical protein